MKLHLKRPDSYSVRKKMGGASGERVGGIELWLGLDIKNDKAREI